MSEGRLGNDHILGDARRLPCPPTWAKAHVWEGPPERSPKGEHRRRSRESASGVGITFPLRFAQP